MKYIVFNNDGEDDMYEMHTHLNGVINDYTLCGITMDGDSQTAGSFSTVDAPKLTCPQCISIVLSCRDKRIKI